MSTLLTLTGPSGVGKSTIVNTLISRYGDIFGDVVAFTTRKPREGEEVGKDYVFMTPEQIKTLQDSSHIAAISKIHGNTYGHTKISIEQACSKGKVGLAVSDLERIAQYKRYGEEIGIKVTSLLILPPSYTALGKRVLVRDRKNGVPKNVTKERWDIGWQEFISKGRKLEVFDKEIINNTLEETVEGFLKIVGIRES